MFLAFFAELKSLISDDACYGVLDAVSCLSLSEKIPNWGCAGFIFVFLGPWAGISGKRLSHA